MEENKNTYKINNKSNIGEVQIAADVVSVIAGLAATEVEGVSSMGGNITKELIAKLGVKNLSKGVKTTLSNESVSVIINLHIAYGYSIPDIALKVQEKVKTAVENMTGLKVLSVDVRISGVDIK